MPLSARIAAPPDAVEARVAAWTEGYAPLSGIPDEFIGADGARRPHWTRLLDLLASLGPDDVSQRFAAADRRIRNRGMSYRVQGETSERVWPLSRMPLLIPRSNGARSRAASRNAPSCWKRCCPTSTARAG